MDSVVFATCVGICFRLRIGMAVEHEVVTAMLVDFEGFRLI